MQSEKQKTQPKKKRLEGPSIVFESRISELEAQLTQTKMDLRKALEDADLYKKKLSDQPLGFESSGGDCSGHRQQIETLQREKNELSENLAKLQVTLAQFREKEADATLKVKRSLDVVDQTQFEKAQVRINLCTMPFKMIDLGLNMYISAPMNHVLILYTSKHRETVKV